jgi:uncharacterized protein (DUF302 family)
MPESPALAMKRRHCSLLLATTFLEGLPTMTSSAEITGISEFHSDLGFRQTLERLMGAIEASHMRIFASIDHAAAAKEVGLSMPPATVLIYGNPKGGTPLMLASPAAALDLPLRVLVREDVDGRTFVSFHPVVPMLVKVGVPESFAARLAPAQEVLINALRQ